MAQRIKILLIDDIDGSDAAETITFSVDGVSYEIDLNEQHAEELRRAFAPWIENGRRVAATRRGRKSATPARTSNAGAIREWARANGYQVSERGRVSAEIREAYEAANG